MGLSDDVDENIRTLIEQVGVHVPSEFKEPGEEELYENMLEGKCVTCGSELGEHTMVMLNRSGIIALFCQGQCATDMQVVGWLNEAYQDIQQSIEFRGGAGDEPTN